MPDIALPALPESALETNGDVFGHENVQGYTADQMASFAREAVMADRRLTIERCAVICDQRAIFQGMRAVAEDNDYASERLTEAKGCAKAIRSLGQ